jgi:putative transposase
MGLFSHFEGSVVGAPLETVRAYVDAQGTEVHARKAAAKATTNSLRVTAS